MSSAQSDSSGREKPRARVRNGGPKNRRRRRIS